MWKVKIFATKNNGKVFHFSHVSALGQKYMIAILIRLVKKKDTETYFPVSAEV